jgi:hypothetical protein
MKIKIIMCTSSRNGYNFSDWIMLMWKSQGECRTSMHVGYLEVTTFWVANWLGFNLTIAYFLNRKDSKMGRENDSEITEFLLSGLSEDSELQPILFGLFLSMYLVTVLGNLIIILASSSDSHLHTPTYFFLCNLSFIDICLASTTVPKMLINIQVQNKEISHRGCLT